MSWGGGGTYVVGTGEVHYRLLVGKPKEKNTTLITAAEGRNIKTVLHEMGWWHGLN
jgi:hypothetical protein